MQIWLVNEILWTFLPFSILFQDPVVVVEDVEAAEANSTPKKGKKVKIKEKCTHMKVWPIIKGHKIFDPLLILQKKRNLLEKL